MDWIWTICMAGLGVGALWALLTLLGIYENTRFLRNRLHCPPLDVPQPKAMLILPCKGLDIDFDRMIQRVLTLDYPDYEITFVVESTDDPAHTAITSLLEKNPPDRPVHIVVAGLAKDCGQKVHNLLAATADIDPSIVVLAFADSDAQLPADWLMWLNERLHPHPSGDPRHIPQGVASGYRWLFPRQRNWAGLFFATLNGRIALAGGRHQFNAVWGGSWAILRETFEQAQVRQAWQGALTEDLPVGHAVRSIGKPVGFEPNCIVPSPVDANWPDMIEFARRQYRIVRIYAPRHWRFTLYNEGLSALTFWGGLIAAIVAAFARGPWHWFAAAVAVHYLAGVVRGLMRGDAVRRLFPARQQELQHITRLDTWLHPLPTLVNLYCFLPTILGREITWRGIRYRMHSPGSTTIVSRSATHD